MNKQLVMTQESFDLLLSWLDRDRDRAGMKYEKIRLRLIKIFVCRGCAEAEDLADETINRVVSKVNQVSATYEGDPALYFYGVAQKMHLEYLRLKHPTPLPDSMPSSTLEDREVEDRETEFECLERCVEELSFENRELVLRYYQEEKRAKIDQRKKLAEELGIGVNALRIRAHRIRMVLQQCVKNCLEAQPAN